MLTTLLRLYFALTTSLADDTTHEMAHHACEVAVYAAVAPDVADDEITDLGETLADGLCRWEPFYVLNTEERVARVLDSMADAYVQENR